MAAISPAYAGPASSIPQQITQPDGSVFQGTLRGDEFQSWLETDKGYTVVKNPATGFYEYAEQYSTEELLPSGIIVSAAARAQMEAQGLMPPKGLRPPPNVELQQYQADFLDTLRALRAPAAPQGGPQNAPSLTGTWSPALVSGSKKILVILVNFANASLSANAATYWSGVVHNPSAPSVATYYQDNSFGAIGISPVAHTQAGNPDGVVTVTLAQNHPNCAGGSCPYSTESGWINSALAAAAPYVNFTALDTNGDGTISVDEALIYFVVAGYETSASSGLTPTYWAHAWGGSGVSVSGKYVNHWALNGELYNASTRMQMGVIAHEMGHAMGGLPDLYDISGKNQGLGVFSLMAGGSWGYQSGQTPGATPVAFDAWSRQYLGWSNPQYPVNGTVFSFVSGLTSPNAPVMLMNSALSTSEYWLVENRPPVSWDAGMYYASAMRSWTGGLLIQHIDLNIGTKSANSFNQYTGNPHQGNMAEEPSTATCSLKATSGSTRGCMTILYYSGNSTAFNGASTPNSNYYSGAASGLGISVISAPGSTMTATLQTTSGTTIYTLTVGKAGAGAGTVNSSPAGINCGTTCSADYTDGPSVTLTAVAAAGSTFTGWSGACTGTSSCVVTMSAARNVTATFASGSTPPGAPTNITVTPYPGRLQVSFTAPVDTGGSAITGYTVTCTAAGQTTRTNTGASSPISVYGLTPGVAYSCTVTASNTAATSAPSTPITSTARSIDMTPILMLLLD
jgi:M6 family metalloprotease-like protein